MRATQHIKHEHQAWDSTWSSNVGHSSTSNGFTSLTIMTHRSILPDRIGIGRRPRTKRYLLPQTTIFMLKIMVQIPIHARSIYQYNGIHRKLCLTILKSILHKTRFHYTLATDLSSSIHAQTTHICTFLVSRRTKQMCIHLLNCLDVLLALLWWRVRAAFPRPPRGGGT